MVAVFDGPGNFWSLAVLVQSSLSLFPVLGLDFQALLSARNPGVSRHRFETPPPSTVKCCLAMFLETYIRDCLSTCQAPAVCPAVNKCIASLSPFPLHHHQALNTQSPSFCCVRNDCLTSIMTPTTQVLSTDNLVWPHGGHRPSLLHIRVMDAAEGPASRLSGLCIPTESQAIMCTHRSHGCHLNT